MAVPSGSLPLLTLFVWARVVLGHAYRPQRNNGFRRKCAELLAVNTASLPNRSDFIDVIEQRLSRLLSITWKCVAHLTSPTLTCQRLAFPPLRSEGEFMSALAHAHLLASAVEA